MSIQDFFLNTDLHEIDFLSVTLRLLLAAIFGGAVGLNRAFNRHAAGFRTHILVCIGATIVMMTNQYMYEVLLYSTDPARLGAQVITGVGFLGAGTILVRGRKVEGLTTAAGLWACACVGLTIGIGFYSASIIAMILIIISLTKLGPLAVKIYKKIDSHAANEYADEHTAEDNKGDIK